MGKLAKKIKNNIRLIIQFSFTAVTNGYLKGFAKGEIYKGKLKMFCVPGLNCYSCPGAVGSCPIGALQATLNSRDYKFAFYVLGFLMLFGAIGGRFICGFLCPFGLVQDLLYKIPFFKKFKNLPGNKYLKWLKYVILAVFVIILPMIVVDITGLGKPWFCEYICPSGTLLAGIPLVLMSENLRSAVGFLYTWKLVILIVLILLSVIFYRPFCKYLCPLGAFYGIFNSVSLHRFAVDKDKCTLCGACKNKCGMDIPVWKKPNSIDCIRCGDCIKICPEEAISIVKFAKKNSEEKEYINRQ